MVERSQVCLFVCFLVDVEGRGATDESWTLAQRGMLTVENPVFWEGDKEGTVSRLPNHKDKERKEGGGEQMCFNLYSTII